MSKKRACPFEENLMPQLKVHVGLKDSADPIEREKEMNKIYERTLQMLKNGAMKSSKQEKILPTTICNLQSSNNNYLKINGFECQPPPPPPRFKQMIINENLGLEISTKVSQSQSSIVVNHCTNCRGELKVLDLPGCFHCMKINCVNCLNQCNKCLEFYCSNCSFTNYDGEEHIECIGCYH